MRALTKKAQARQDDAERVYQPRVKLFIGLESELNVDVLKCALDMLIARNPWKDSMMKATASDWISDIDGNCSFDYDEEAGCFVSSSSILPMRRGQLLAFENWVHKLLSDFRCLRPPSTIIASVCGTINYEREIPFMMGSPFR